MNSPLRVGRRPLNSRPGQWWRSALQASAMPPSDRNAEMRSYDSLPRGRREAGRGVTGRHLGITFASTARGLALQGARFARAELRVAFCVAAFASKA